MKRSIFVLACVGLLSLLASCSNAPTCYYIDPSLGDDLNAGTSAAKPWKSFANVEGLVLQPGEQLLLKRGETFNEQLTVCGRGNADSLVFVGAYGEGTMPVVSAPDSSLFAVKVTNSDYLTIAGIEIVNKGSVDMPRRCGLHIEVLNYGVSHNIVADSLYIHDVNGSLVKTLGGGSGIYISYEPIRIWGQQPVESTLLSRFDSLTIQNCHIVRCQRNAMIWQEKANRNEWNPSTNVVVRGNLIEEVPGDGIVPIWTDGCLVEYNIMRNCPEILPDTEAAAGFWPWSADNTVIQFNEVSDHKAPWDAQAYDCDYNCHNTTIQYNYSHDNYGGLCLICTCAPREVFNVGNINSVVQYNLSINDGLRPNLARGVYFSPSIHIAGPSKNALVAHNVIHQNVKPLSCIDTNLISSDDWEGVADGATIEGNIFYSANESHFDMGTSTNNSWKGNYFIGLTVAPEAASDQDELSPSLEDLSDFYTEKVLTKGEDGFDGLSELLLEEKEICGVTGHFISKEKIEALFK